MPKQNELPISGPGVARPKIKAIEVAADDYSDIRDTRMAWTKKEVSARDKLVDVMAKNNLERYQFGDHEVVMVPGKAKVKVRTINGEETDDETDE